ncbi:hypothetical protein MP638_005880 [Amoeboaphelidium occidentale]|nr:hypothetical protein MP638_005880 [Amoeboaphelidium occidentale]
MLSDSRRVSAEEGTAVIEFRSPLLAAGHAEDVPLEARCHELPKFESKLPNFPLYGSVDFYDDTWLNGKSAHDVLPKAERKEEFPEVPKDTSVVKSLLDKVEGDSDKDDYQIKLKDEVLDDNPFMADYPSEQVESMQTSPRSSNAASLFRKKPVGGVPVFSESVDDQLRKRTVSNGSAYEAIAEAANTAIAVSNASKRPNELFSSLFEDDDNDKFLGSSSKSVTFKEQDKKVNEKLSSLLVDAKPSVPEYVPAPVPVSDTLNKNPWASSESIGDSTADLVLPAMGSTDYLVTSKTKSRPRPARLQKLSNTPKSPATGSSSPRDTVSPKNKLKVLFDDMEGASPYSPNPFVSTSNVIENKAESKMSSLFDRKNEEDTRKELSSSGLFTAPKESKAISSTSKADLFGDAKEDKSSKPTTINSSSLFGDEDNSAVNRSKLLKSLFDED